MVTSAMAGEILGCSPSYVRRLLLKGKLQGIKLGHDWILTRFDVESYKTKYINQKEVKG